MDRLTIRAEKYIAAIGVVLALHVVELPALKFKSGMWEIISVVLVVLGFILLSVALVLAIHGMRLQDYATFADSTSLRKLGADETSEEVAKRSVAIMYLDLRDQILAKNQNRARGIVAAGYLLLAGFMLSLAGQIIVRFIGSLY